MATVAPDLHWLTRHPLRILGRMKRRHLNRFQIRRLRRASRRTRALVLGGVTALGIVAILPILTGRTTPRWFALESARQAVVQAQNTNADDWAPGDLRQAEAMFQVARIEHRHQELRILPLRDFTQAELLLREAERLASATSAHSLRVRQATRDSARVAITRAADSVGKGVAFSEAMHLAVYDRRLLTSSRLALEEAELLHRRGEYTLATKRALAAGSQAERVSGRAAQAASRYTDAGLVQNWRQWMKETISWSERSGAAAIVVQKDKHELTVYARGKAVKTYRVELGFNSIGNKWRAGDSATPEGRYHITAKKPAGQSGYHMALLLDYPNAEDRRRFDAARRVGRLPRNASLGSLIEIHGEGGRGKDWTKGCVALANDDIDDLFKRIGVGTPVTIVGGDGNGGTYTKLVGMHRAEPTSAGLD